MTIPTQQLAKKITKYEGKTEEVNIAQANEIARILPFILSEYSLSEIREWVRTGTIKELKRLREENAEFKSCITEYVKKEK